jgi:hypothetical protein
VAQSKYCLDDMYTGRLEWFFGGLGLVKHGRMLMRSIPGGGAGVLHIDDGGAVGGKGMLGVLTVGGG